LALGEHPTHVVTMLAGARAEAGQAVVDEVDLCEILRDVVIALDTSLEVDRARTAARPRLDIVAGRRDAHVPCLHLAPRGMPMPSTRSSADARTGSWRRRRSP